MGDFVSSTKKYVLSGLEQADYKLPGWSHIFNKNIELLSELLRVQGLVDVDGSYLPNKGVLVWKATPGKWRVRKFE